MDKELTLYLNGEEALLLCSRVKNWDVDFVSGALIAPYLLLRLFSAFNELVTDKGFSMQEMPVVVSERELWLLRNYVQPSDRITEKNPLLGIKLMKKLHALILEANCDVGLEQIETECHEWAEKQPVPIRKEPEDARETEPDKDPGNDPAEDTGDKPWEAA